MGSHLVILTANTENLFTSPELRKEVTRKLGSAWVPGTRDIVRGLTTEEEKKYLPKYLGVRPEDTTWDERLTNFWAGFVIDVPVESGIQLEMGTDDEGNPLILDQYMKAHFAKNHQNVANDISERSIKKFYLEDLQRKKQLESEQTNLLVKGDTEFTKLITDASEAGKSKLNYMLWLMGRTPTRLDHVEKIRIIRKLKEESTQEFLNLVEDKDLPVKAFIQRCLIYSVLKIEGSSYYAEDVKLGGSEIETIEFIKSPENSAVVGRIKERLNYQTK